MQYQNLSTLDFNDYLKGTNHQKQDFIQLLGDSLSEIGFFSLVNANIDEDLKKAAYQCSKDFFKLSKAIKSQYENVDKSFNRGYFSFGREHAKDSLEPDLKEYFHIGPQLSAENNLSKIYPKNIWPSEICSMKNILLQLYSQIENCALSLLEACSIYIGEEKNLLREMAVDGNSILRLLYYPALKNTSHKQGIRAAAHEDINLITLLITSTADGLEIKNNKGQWLAANAEKNSVIVDCGDMIQQITNGLFKSTTHRVVNPTDENIDRYSMPFFVHPKSYVDLTPLKKSVHKTGNKVLFPKITAGDYLQQRLNEIGVGNY